MQRRTATPLMISHGLAAALGVAALTFWPPASGRMLIVPIDGSDVNAVTVAAVAGGAQVLGSGAWPGSLVVQGDRTSIAAQYPSWHVLLLASPPATCGSAVAARIAA